MREKKIEELSSKSKQYWRMGDDNDNNSFRIRYILNNSNEYFMSLTYT